MSAAKSKYLKTSKKFESRIELTGSFRKLPTGTNIGNTSFNQVIEVMVKIRRKNPIRNYIRGITAGKTNLLAGRYSTGDLVLHRKISIWL